MAVLYVPLMESNMLVKVENKLQRLCNAFIAEQSPASSGVKLLLFNCFKGAYEWK